jgi:riboflavin kinase/FMN adenylyltransferase
MKVYRSLDEVPPQRRAWVSVGVFDGVHLAHQRILGELVRQSKAEEGQSLLVTFDPHPQAVLRVGAVTAFLLTPTEEKLALLGKTDLDGTAVLPFTDTLAGLGPDAFIEGILIKRCPVRKLVIGYNHAFGRERSGNVRILEQLGRRHGFEVQVESPMLLGGEAVSSTRIRNLLSNGRIPEANRLLGRPYAIIGRVIRGKGLGRGFGFPTANVQIDNEAKLIPQNGVYAGYVRVRGEEHKGLVNIGNCPTVGTFDRGIEVYILDFNSEIYEESIQFDFAERLRDERKFESVRSMIGQMKKDRIAALNLPTRQGG